MRYYFIHDATHILAIHKTKDSALACYHTILKYTPDLVLKEVDTDNYGMTLYERNILKGGVEPLSPKEDPLESVIMRKDTTALSLDFLHE